jgi:hypothetical protein
MLVVHFMCRCYSHQLDQAGVGHEPRNFVPGELYQRPILLEPARQCERPSHV